MKIADWHQRYQQQARWTAELRAYLYQRAGLRPGSRVLEIGCGTGVVLQETSQAQEPSALHGLDIDAASLRWARRSIPATYLVQGDAHALPYPEGHFEAVYCHFLLLWVEEPAIVVQEMVRVTRPGGAVLAFAEPDYGGRIDHPPELEILGENQRQSLQHQGANPRLGRALRGIFHQAGLTQVESGVLGAQWQAPPEADAWELEWAVLEADLAKHPLPGYQLSNLKARDAQAYQEGERVLYVPTFYAWGHKGKG